MQSIFVSNWNKRHWLHRLRSKYGVKCFQLLKLEIKVCLRVAIFMLSSNTMLKRRCCLPSQRFRRLAHFQTIILLSCAKWRRCGESCANAGKSKSFWRSMKNSRSSNANFWGDPSWKSLEINEEISDHQTQTFKMSHPWSHWRLIKKFQIIKRKLWRWLIQKVLGDQWTKVRSSNANFRNESSSKSLEINGKIRN